MSSTRPDLKFSDAVDERSFYRRFSNLAPKESPATVRIVDHKDYFVALGADAALIAEAIYKTSSVLKTAHGVAYVTFSPQVFASVLQFCLVANAYKVEIYNRAFALTSSASPGNWERVAQAYAVDVEAMVRDGSVPVVASVKVAAGAGGTRVGVCWVDMSARAIRLSQFDDNDVFSGLESLLLQVNAKEVVLPAAYRADDRAAPATAKLFQVLGRIGGLVVGAASSGAYTTKDIEQDLAKIVAADHADGAADGANGANVELLLAAKGISSTADALSLACCSALVGHLGLLADDAASYTIAKYSAAEYMRLDASTMRALNIFPGSQTGAAAPGAGTAVTSIFDLLNKCRTSAGTRLLSQWLKQPLTDAAQVADRHALVGHFIADQSLRTYATAEWLPHVPDIKRLVKKVAAGVQRPAAHENKKLDDVVRLYQLVRSLPDLLSMLRMSHEECSDRLKALLDSHWIAPVHQHHAALLKFQELVETTVDLSPLDAAHASLHTDFNIKPEFDESLVSISANLQRTSAKIQSVHREAADDLGIEADKKLKLENSPQHGWCMRVTRIDSSVLRSTGDRYLELQTVKAGVFFTTKKLRALSQDYADYTAEYNSKQKELVREILDITATYQGVFLRLSLALSSLDVLAAFAHVAIFSPIPFVQPKLHKLADTVDSPAFRERRISLKEARHPVLEVQDDVNFIPNDVSLANCDGSPFVIITGPNMGGKSTYIRQIGVIALMSQVGSYVPVSEESEKPEVPIFDAILSRVGAGDSQLKGLSTFMIEMLETSSILASATHNSLIIIDELGRGTSTYDGFGLAWAISEHIITEKNCFTLFATHFHELTKLSDKHAGKVQNLHVVAHVEKNGDDTTKDDDITLMFKVEPGISDKSFGIHVAELVKFPTKIINMAKRKASELQNISVGSDTDPYVSSKRTKCSTEEISVGLDKLKQVLATWRAQCVGADSKCNVSSEEAIRKLQELMGSGSAEVKDEKFIQEILSML